MQGQRIGYIRVSTFSQNTARQLDGVELDRVFIEKASAKDTKRPQLRELIAFTREGDTVIVHSIDRLARNLLDLIRLVYLFVAKGVEVQFVKEQLSFSAGKDSPIQKLLLSVMGSIAEFERSIILERRAEGIEIARQQGRFAGRPWSVTEEIKREIIRRVPPGYKTNATKISRELGVSTSLVYRVLKEARMKEAEVEAHG